MDHLAFVVEQPRPERGIGDDRAPGDRIPESDVPQRVTRQVEDLDREMGTEAKHLAANEVEINRHIRTQRVSQPVFRVGVVVRVRTVRRVPAVALAQDPLPVADPVAIRDVGTDDRPRRRGSYRGVAAKVVDVGVGDQHVVEVGRIESQFAEGGQDDFVGRRHDPGVDQE